MRLPLATDLESRDGLVTRDALTRNAIVEVVGDKLKMRRRPGLEDYGGLIRAGVAQLLTYWRDTIITVIDDYINVGDVDTALTTTTLNPSDKGSQVTLSGGNLTFSVAASVDGGFARSIASISAGTWYWECAPGANNGTMIGVANASADVDDNPSNAGLHTLVYTGSGTIYRNNALVATGASYTSGDTIGILMDATERTVSFYKNGTLQAAITSANVPTGALYALCGAGSGGGGGVAAFDVIQEIALSVSTADLPMSAQDNGENAPKPYLMLKNSEKAWSLDQNFSVAAITDVDYPATYTVTLTSLTRSGTTATATTASDVNFQVGQSVTIAGANQSDYNGAKAILSVTPSHTVAAPDIAITITRSGTTATATTVSAPHGFTNGQSITISGAGQSEYNGTFTITWISATQFSFTVTVSTGNAPASPATGSPVLGTDIQMSIYGGNVSLWNDFGTYGNYTTVVVLSGYLVGLANGETIRVTGSLYSPDGAATVNLNGTYTVANVGPSGCTITVSGLAEDRSGNGNVVKVISPAATISSITFSQATGLATVTTSGAHSLATNNQITISGATQAAYNGTQHIQVTSTTTFTYSVSFTADRPATPATGTIVATGAGTVVGASFTFTVANSPTTPATGTITATGGRSTVPGIVYFDGYFLVMDVNGVVYNSAEDDPTTWAALEYLIAQTETGAGKAIARTVNYVVCFKEWSTEFLWNAGNEPPGSPFSPVPNSAVLIGCVEGWSVAEVSGNLLWIGQGKKVQGRGVYMMAGTQPVKVSSPDVDRIIARDSLAEVYAYGVELDGHPCYVLTLGNTDVTLVYDLVSKVWGTWTSLTAGSSKSVSSITLSGTTATVTFGVAHTLSDGDPVLIAGANQAAYNGIHQAAYVSSTVVTIEVAAGTTTPATGTITGTPYTESAFKMVKYANCGGLNIVLHESDGHLYKILSTLYQDDGIPINHFARSRREDGGTLARKKLPRISLVADSASDTAMIRWSDDDCATFSSYRRVTLSEEEPMLTQCGSFKRRTFEYRHIGNSAPVVEALEMEVTR